MKDFFDYLRNEKIALKLIEHYKVPHLKCVLEDYLNNICGNVQSSTDFNNNYDLSIPHLDIFGNEYEQKIPPKERKTLGEFYTPNQIVNYILEAVGFGYNKKIENKKLIDISCGSGSFLAQAIRILINRFYNGHKVRKNSGSPSERARFIVSRIKQNIYGIDINPLACILCQIHIHFILFTLMKDIRIEDNDYILPIFNIKHSNALTITETDEFNFVVGNPPYLFIRDIPNDQKRIIRENNFCTNEGQYDYYQIFIELGIRFLKNNGLLGYIVPDSLLALSNRLIIRKFIYHNTKIKEIYHIGPSFQESVVSNTIIILEKEKNANNREKNWVNTKTASLQQNIILQDSFKNWNFKFLIHLDDIDISILNNISNNNPKLNETITKKDYRILLSRGVELTKTGEIIFCGDCKKFFPLPKKDLTCPNCKQTLRREQIEKIITDSVPIKDKGTFKLFIYSLNRYQIKEYKYININKNGINYKDLEIYKERIIIRQLSQNNLICATYDKNFSLTSQSFYNLKIIKSPIKEFNNKYLLGLINSKLLSFYFIKSFGSYKKLFPRILIEKIKNLPIKIPESDKEKVVALKIIKKVEIMLQFSEDKGSRYYRLEEEIDNLVFDLYNIPDSNQLHILDFLNHL